jgi:hypothetical protein
MAPQFAIVGGSTHAFPEQQPFGHEVGLQTHVPLTHCCPAPHAGPVPH